MHIGTAHGHPAGGQQTQQQEPARGLGSQGQQLHRQQRLFKDGAVSQQLPQGSHQQDGDAQADGVVDALAEGFADGFQFGGFHTLDNDRFHHHHGQIDPHDGKVGAENIVHDDIHRDIQDGGRVGIHHRAEPVAGDVADRHRQHTGGGEQQDGQHAEHEGAVSVAGHGHNRGQTQAADHDRVVQPQMVIVDALGQFGLGFRPGLAGFGLGFRLGFGFNGLLRSGLGLGRLPRGSGSLLVNLLRGLAFRSGTAGTLQHFGRKLGNDDGLGMFRLVLPAPGAGCRFRGLPVLLVLQAVSPPSS